MINFLKEYLKNHIQSSDKRQTTKIIYEIDTIFILVFIGYLCSYTTILGISHFIQRNQKIFQEYGLLKDENCPSKTTIYRLLDIISWTDIKTMANSIYEQLPDSIKNEMINKDRISKIIDGKFIVSGKRGRKRGYNVVTLYDANTGLPIDQYCVNTHDSEKNALPNLIKTLNAGDIISGDAIFCDKTVMKALAKNQIKFVLTLKKNNKHLLNLSKTLMNDKDFLTEENEYEKVVELDVKNGYVIKRTFEKIEYSNNIDLIDGDYQYVGVRVCVKRTIEKTHKKTGRTTISTTYFITNMFNMEKIVKTIKEHWLIESYHWYLDMVLDEDHSSVTNKNVAMNLNILRKLVLLTMRLPEFQYKGISKADSLKVNLENIAACIDKLM